MKIRAKQTVGGLLVAGGLVIGAPHAGAVDDCEASTAGAAGESCTGVAVGGQGAPADGTGVAGETQVLGTTQVRGQQLPVTGSESLIITMSGIALVSAGGALIWRSRRPEAA